MEIGLLIAIMIFVLVDIATHWISAQNKKISEQEINKQFKQLKENSQHLEQLILSELQTERKESRINERDNRQEIAANIALLGQNISQTIDSLAHSQKTQLNIFSNRLKELAEIFANTQKQNREEITASLNAIREENTNKLDQIKTIVDDKLKETLEKRFNDSFKLISDRLELVHKGLGEMHTLANGVGDLKKVLSNVKTRGNLGEVQLGNILGQILAPEQYITNAAVNPDTRERVEFAVKLPGPNPGGESVLLPIDSKFPIEDYQRLLDAYDNGNDIENEGHKFEISVKKNAADIHDKYILPPQTTDFAIMFVPTEGLYAEILRRPGLFETLRNDYKITVTGPANLAAFLSSLQMGFRTLAIEKRSSEVWKLLSSVKTEFTKFGDILDKTRKKLVEATNVIDQAGVRTRAIERSLRDVENVNPAIESGD